MATTIYVRCGIAIHIISRHLLHRKIADWIGNILKLMIERISLCCLIVAANIPMQTISYKLGEARTPSEKVQNFRIVMSS